MNDGAASEGEGPVNGGCMTCWEAIEVILALGGRLDYMPSRHGGAGERA